MSDPAGSSQRLSFPGERQIVDFPGPYLNDSNPSGQTAYSPSVKETCSKKRTTAEFSSCKLILVGDMAVGKTAMVNRFCHNSFSRDYKATIGVDFEVEKFTVLGVPFRLFVWDTAGEERFKSIAKSYYRNARIVLVCFDMSNLHSLASCSTWLDEVLHNISDLDSSLLAGIDAPSAPKPPAGGHVADTVDHSRPANSTAPTGPTDTAAAHSSQSSTPNHTPPRTNTTDCRSPPVFTFLVGCKKDLLAPSCYEQVERDALDVAKQLSCEFWPVSSKTGENVRELFMRATAVAFDRLVADEIRQSPKASPTKIGSPLIKLNRSADAPIDATNRKRCCAR